MVLYLSDEATLEVDEAALEVEVVLVVELTQEARSYPMWFNTNNTGIMSIRELNIGLLN